MEVEEGFESASEEMEKKGANRVKQNVFFLFSGGMGKRRRGGPTMTKGEIPVKATALPKGSSGAASGRMQ